MNQMPYAGIWFIGAPGFWRKLSSAAGQCRLHRKKTVPEMRQFSLRLNECSVKTPNSPGLDARFITRFAELACLPAEMRLLLDGHGGPRRMTDTEARTGIGTVEAAGVSLAYLVTDVTSPCVDYDVRGA